MKRFLSITRRYWQEMLLTAAVVTVIGGAITFLLPTTYKSTATFLVERDETASEAWGESFGGYADRRIQILARRVFSKANLNTIALEHGLYSEVFSGSPLSELDEKSLGHFRNQIDLTLVKVKAADAKSRFLVESAIAFEISYIDESPEKAKEVLDSLVELFMQENQSDRSPAKTAASELFAQEEARLKSRLAEAEGTLRDFKQKNAFTLPDQRENNLRMLDKTESELFDLKQSLRSKIESQVFLRAELSRLKPHSLNFDAEGRRILGADDRLKTLQAELGAKRARYSDAHLDIIRLEGEIASLGVEVGGAGESSVVLMERVKALRGELAQLRDRYSANHPSVLSVSRQLESLERGLAAQRSSAARSPRVTNADNPAYIATTAQLESVKLDIRDLQGQVEKLNRKYDEYELRIEAAPAVEREFNVLDREYTQILGEYEETRKRGFATKLAGSLENSGNFQGLSILEGANFPEAAYKPNRKVLLASTVLLASWLALGIAYLRDQFDDRVWDGDALKELLGEVPLAVIPDEKIPV